MRPSITSSGTSRLRTRLIGVPCRLQMCRVKGGARTIKYWQDPREVLVKNLALAKGSGETVQNPMLNSTVSPLTEARRTETYLVMQKV